MTGADIDTYIVRFGELAQKARYQEDDPAVLDKFKRGLPICLLDNCMNLDTPQNWEQWKNAACNRQAIQTALEPHQQAFWQLKKKNQQQQRQFLTQPGQNRNNRGQFSPQHTHQPTHDPDAMQVDHMRKATTEADKERYKKEGRCFNCMAQGHLSRTCPKKSTTRNQVPVVARKITDEVTIKEEGTYTAKGVLNFMKGMDDEQYQSLAEAWMQMAQGEGEGFGQA